MPEGDTLYRSAAVLAKALTGRSITRVRAELAAFVGAELEGRVFAKVEARGKHLLMHLDDGRTIASHLGMHGSWHIYRHGERWKARASDMRLVIETDVFVAVVFRTIHVRLLKPGAVERDKQISSLGPDLMTDAFDAELAVDRLAARSTTPIGVALLDQRALAGIGNVWKNEVMFQCRANPFRAVGAFTRGELRAMVDRAQADMRTTRVREERVTRHALTGPKRWVYGRAGQPCLVCGTRIATYRQGLDGRTTYYCRVCQRVGPQEDD